MAKSNEVKFRLLWNELARTGEEYKEEAWKRLKLGVDTDDNYCPACNESLKRREKLFKNQEQQKEDFKHFCETCPVQWPRGVNCDAENSLWLQWEELTGDDPAVTRKRKKIAAKIALLPWK